MTIPNNQNQSASGLMGAEALLEALFPGDPNRPSERWLRHMRARRLVPFKKVGGRVFYDPAEVRRALDGFSVPTLAENSQL
jgi:hypothetical protein